MPARGAAIKDKTPKGLIFPTPKGYAPQGGTNGQISILSFKE